MVSPDLTHAGDVSEPSIQKLRHQNVQYSIQFYIRGFVLTGCDSDESSPSIAGLFFTN